VAERTILSVVLITTLVAAGPVVIAQNQEQVQWGKPIDGVEVSLSFDEQNSLPSALHVKFRNTGTSAKKIVLGGGCGPIHETNAITLEVTDERGQKHRFQDETSNWPCGGRMAAYEVALLPGAEFSVPLRLENYGPISPAMHAIRPGFEPGRDYVVAALLPFDPSAWFGAPPLFLTGSPTGVSPCEEMTRQAVASKREHLMSNALHVEIPVPR
jgi:hypothetical protein